MSVCFDGDVAVAARTNRSLNDRFSALAVVTESWLD